MKLIGEPIDRVDARLKVTGAAQYAYDTPVAKVAHAVIVTSTIARGTITSLDVTLARKQPGVLAVIAHGNAPKVNERRTHQDQPRPNERWLQLLQEERIYYNDQPIALVVADTLEHAQHAATLVVAKYHVEAPVADLVSNLGAAFRPRTGGPQGPADTTRGNASIGLARGAIQHVATYTTPNENHNPMEPHGTIAVWHGNDRVTLYDATQGVFGVRQRISEIFGISKENVRVIDHHVGGGFGCKGTPWSHVALAAMAARVVARPVKLVVTRPQMFSLVGHRPKTVQTIALACDREGTLTGIRHDVVSETSQIDEFVEPAAFPARMLYACPSVSTSHRLVRIDAPTPTFQRAPGYASGNFALESALDELAFAAGIDPLDVRLRNYALRDEQENKPWSSKSLRECYRAAADRFGWHRRNPTPRSMRAGRELIGLGMATASYPAHQWPASARAKLRADGSVLVQAGTQDLGTGTYTIMTQTAADALGMPVARVVFELGDTAYPEAPVSGGSATTSSVGPAVKAVCEQLGQKIAALTPEQRASGVEVTAEVHSDVDNARDKYATHSFGADFVEVHVDEDLGHVRVARVVAAFAAGRILNEKTAKSQLMGGIVWSIGMALEEATVRDGRSARVVTRDLADYHVPVNADVPPIDVILVPEEDPHVNTLGCKGIGELGITGATAAIANAVFHATGKRIRDLPITIDKLL